MKTMKMRCMRAVLLALSMVLMMVVMPLLFMPVQAANDAVTEVRVNDIELNYAYKYLVNGVASQTGMLGIGGCTAHFESTTGTLTLQNYNSGTISGGGVGAKDLTIKLIGINSITKSGSGQYMGIRNSSPGGDITITAENDALLIIDLISLENFVYGIAGDISGGSTTGNVTLSGKAKVTVNVTAQSTDYGMSAIGIFAKQTVSILDNASYTATCKANTLSDSLQAGTAIFAGSGVFINTAGDVMIDTSACGVYNYGIYGSSANILENVKTMTIQWTQGGPYNRGGPIFYEEFSNQSYVEANYVIKNDTTNHVATYRRGIPREVMVTDGYAVDDYMSNHKYLAGDIVTVIANEPETYYAFKEWQGAAGLTFVDGTSKIDSNAKFSMPGSNVNVTATYECTFFTAHPTVESIGATNREIPFSWEISDDVGMIYYAYIEEYIDGVWVDYLKLSSQYEASGTHSSSVYSETAGSKTYRLYYYSGKDYYSKEFTMTWEDAEVTNINLSPLTATIKKGTTQKFECNIVFDPLYSGNVTWSLEGNNSSDTTLDGNENDYRILTVGADETSKNLTLKVTSDDDENKSATAIVNVTDKVVEEYVVTVIDGEGSGKYTEGETVYVKAKDFIGQSFFSKWVSTDVDIHGDSVADSDYSFIIGKKNIILTAIYGDDSYLEKLAGTVSISGIVKADETLTATVSNCNETNLYYRWIADSNLSGGIDETTFLIDDDAGIGWPFICEITSPNKSGSIIGVAGIMPKREGLELTGVTADDYSNTLTGMTGDMEFSMDDGITWITYDETTPNLPDLTGTLKLQIRFKEDYTYEAGAATTFKFKDLSFTTNSIFEIIGNNFVVTCTTNKSIKNKFIHSALYDNNKKLIDYKMISSNNDSLNFTFNFQKSINAKTLKVFIWEDVKSCEPISQGEILNLK